MTKTIENQQKQLLIVKMRQTRTSRGSNDQPFKRYIIKFKFPPTWSCVSL